MIFSRAFLTRVGDLGERLVPSLRGWSCKDLWVDFLTRVGDLGERLVPSLRGWYVRICGLTF